MNLKRDPIINPELRTTTTFDREFDRSRSMGSRKRNKENKEMREGDLPMAVFTRKRILFTVSGEGIVIERKVKEEIAGSLLARLTKQAHDLGCPVYLCSVVCAIEPKVDHGSISE